MRLLFFDDNTLLCFHQFYEDDLPPYAILSYTWGLDSEEVTFKDLQDGTAVKKVGYGKIAFCGYQAKAYGILSSHCDKLAMI
jgi:hypothetical protein